MTRSIQSLSFVFVFMLVPLVVPTTSPASDIPFEYIEEERQRVYSTGEDFDSWGELKEEARRFLKEYECPRCKGHQCEGGYVYFQVRKVDIYNEVEKPGFFGGTKKVDEFVKTAWRIEDIYLKQADGGFGLLSDETEGYIKCTRRDCGWEVKGGEKPKNRSGVVWLSINDIVSGNWRNKIDQ